LCVVCCAVNSKVINRLNPEQRRKVLERIPARLPLKIVGPLIHDELYWERSCKARWPVCDVALYGNAWKRMFFERNLGEIVEGRVPYKTNPARLSETLVLSAPHVRRLDVRALLPPMRDSVMGAGAGTAGGSGTQFEDLSETASEHGDEPETDHIDFTPIFNSLSNLVEFRVTYGVKDCGMNFEWKLFQFTLKDCQAISKCLQGCKQLKLIEIHRSRIDCDKVRLIISHLLDHPSLESLSFEQNLISDRGARAVGKLLNGHAPRLQHLNLCNNDVRPAGALAVAHALCKNTTLQSLNMRLNHIGDDGGQAVCKALLKNVTLKTLDLESNEMTEPSAALLAQVLIHNRTLTRLNLACNSLGLVLLCLAIAMHCIASLNSI